MKFLKNIWSTLKKPFPIEESFSDLLRMVILTSIFVTFFLYVFKPFNIDGVKSGHFMICLGFGLMTFLASMIYEFFMVRVFKFKHEQTNFTYWKWIIYIIGVMLAISLANFFYVGIWFGNIQWRFLPNMIYGTFAIGVFPCVAAGALALFRSERKYQNIAAEINEEKTHPIENTSQNEQTIFDIPTRQIRYIEALQNYIKIGYLHSENQLKETTQRATLKSILDELEGSPIIKCHRSYLVNREAIESTSGNAQGLVLTLMDCDKKIPVSRSYVAQFRIK